MPFRPARRSAVVVVLFSASFVLTGLPSPAPAQAAASVAGEVYATTPTKVLDTRTGLGAPKAALGAGRTLLLTLAGKGGIPASGAASAVLQLTALSTTASTSLTVWPTGAARPATPNISVTVGRTTTVAITSKLGSAGRVSIFNAAGAVQLAAHTEAWSTTGATAAAGSRLAPLAPARVLDTRAGLGAPRAALGAGRTLVFAVAGRGGVPATGAAAVGLSLTALSATTRTSLTVYPYGAARPATPNLYLNPGQTVAAALTTRLGSAGKVVVFNAAGSVQVSADVQGAFRTAYPSGGRLTALQPARLARTAVGAGRALVVQVTGKGGVPASTAVAVALSVTGSGTSASSTALTVYPYGAARPATPNVFVPHGATVMNAVLAKLGTGGRVSVFNASGTTTVAVDVQGVYLVPPTVVPPNSPDTITTTGAHSLYETAKFLFTGTSPPQAGVAATTIKPERIGVVRGTVTAKGIPLGGVAITVLNHPEYGTTRTASDGGFSLAVNAGGPVVLSYALAGYSGSQRQPATKVGEYVHADDVALVPLDTKVTAVTTATATTTTAAVSSPVTDADGTRTNAVLFPAGTTVTAKKADGSAVTLPATLHVRATEYTVGTTGAAQMPGDLPDSSGYTYATELSVDEATAGGATTVDFSKPLANYVDNFLNFPVGTAVPAGYYDRTKAVWVASTNGLVVKVISVTGGVAQLDTDGNGSADNTGVDLPERTRLGGVYAAGKTLWRVPITHFTPWDYNWPYGLPDDAVNWEKKCMGEPGATLARCKAEAERDHEDRCQESGSIIGCQDQTLGESLPLIGTPLHLRYSSGNAAGRTSDRRIRIPLTFSSVPASLQSVRLEIDVAGQHRALTFGTGAQQSYTFVWDGLDGFGRPVNGAQDVAIRVGYVYPAVYKTSAAALTASFALAGGATLAGNDARDSITVWQDLSTTVGALHPDSDGLGGWTLDVHQSYDPVAHTVHLGTGTAHVAASAAQGVLSTLALTGVAASSINDIAAGPDGSLYAADASANKVLKVTPSGVVSVLAGTGTAGYQGDDGPATAAQLYAPTYLAVGPDGSVYVTDGSTALISRVRRITPNGIIRTVAGTFNAAYDGDGKLAVDASLQNPQGVAVGDDGSLYIADTGNNRVRRVNPDGIITTVAGNGTSTESGDGGPAVSAGITPFDVGVAQDGTLYVSTAYNTIRAVNTGGTIHRVAGDTSGSPNPGGTDPLTVAIDPTYLDVAADGVLRFTEQADNRVRSLTPGGGLATVIGSGACSFDNTKSGDGGVPTAGEVCQPTGLTTAPGGAIYVVQSGFAGPGIRRVGSIWPGFQLGETTLTDRTGTQVWVFDSNGRHKRTLDALTGAVAWQFGYDGSGRLLSVTDSYGNVTAISRSATTGAPLHITAPGGQRTTLTTSAAGDLTSVTDPLGHGVTLSYAAGGLLSTLSDALGRQHTFDYASDGRLLADHEPDGTQTTLTGTSTDTSSTVVVTRPGNEVTTFVDDDLATGGHRSRSTGPTGSVTTSVTSADGLTSTVSHDDGSSTTTTYAPDRRWGMQVPFATSVVATLPSGHAVTRTDAQSVTLSDPANLLSLTGQVITDTLAGKTTTTTWDGAARTSTTVTAAGRSSTSTYDSHGRVLSVTPSAGVDPVTHSYDSLGRTTSQTIAGVTTSLGYDSANRLVSRTTGTETETLGYDAADRLTAVTTPAGEHYQYAYDAVGNRTSVTLPGAVHQVGWSNQDQQASYTPPGSAAYTRTYTAAHTLATTTLPSGAVETHTRDSGGRETGVASPEATTALTYEGTTAREATSSWTPTVGVAQTITRSWDGPLVTALASAAGSVSYAYDARQLVSSRILAAGSTRAVTHDDDGRLTGDGPFTLTRNGPGGLTSNITDGTSSQDLSYDTAGRPAGRSLSVSGAAVYTGSLTYDSAGRVATRTDGASTSAYTYDPDGRLIGVSQGGTPVAAYTYDQRGNRVGSGDPAALTTATYDSQDRLVDRGGTRYTYDADGFLIARGTDTFTWTRRGELLSATVAGTTVTYAYDAQRRRVSRTQGGVVTTYLYAEPDDDLLVTSSTTGTVVSELLYDSSHHLYAVQRGAIRYSVATDGLGSPQVVADAAGTVIEQLTYDAWGQVTQDTDPTFGLVVGYAGGLRDDSTGLVRFGLRDYEPLAGRWVARDPALFEGGQGNLYVYVGNQPTGRTDPTGLWGISIGGSFCVIGCLEAKISIGSNGLQACGGTGLGLGAGVDAGFTPGDVDTANGLYLDAAAGIGPVSIEAREFSGVCKDQGSVSACLTVVCVDQDTLKKGLLTTSVDPRELGEDLGRVLKPKLSESLEAKATFGGCAGTEF